MTKSFTIKQAAIELGVEEHYIRVLVLKGKLPTTKVQVGNTKTWRHEIAADVIEAWKARQANHTSRTDGRNKYVVYLTKEEFKQVQAEIEKIGKGLIQRANPAKVK